MSSAPQVKCRCGSTNFESSKPIRSLDDFVGAKCEKCGRAISRKEIDDQARSLAEAVIKKSLKNFKL
ncbi:ECs_2282 family putative zinc-binding protein [Pseudomonas sp. SED1]|uniref:ECs_2282 family putative zinc-binding protein n=1 Tax=Pseudomonas sp. SED1 TaxID=3056845 RepID=UPI003990C0E0